MKTWHRYLIRILAAGMVTWQAAAQTDGTATFSVTTVTDGGTYSPRNVFAVWVTDAQTNFVKTLLCRAASQERWLIQWNGDSGGNKVDGITGATRTSHGPVSVTWNARNSAGSLVPDGTYRIFVEFTERNGQGPFTSAVSFVKGTSPVSLTPPNLPRFTSMSLTYTPLTSPPEIQAIGYRAVTEGDVLSFEVTASPTGGDPVTLTASNLPAGASFYPTNSAGMFVWPAAAPLGVYTSRFYAEDKDGVAVAEAILHVRAPGSAAFGAAFGSPVILSDPPSDPNTPGDNIDVDESGGFAVTTDQGGFGDFGRVYVNADDSYLYLSGEGSVMAGDNNGMILFLGINTLADDRLNLWGASGSPNALGYLSNVRFAAPMDVAIVLGDEYGDANFPNFNLGDGYNYGQGVYRLGASGFIEVAGVRLAQFDGAGFTACITGNDDADRLTDRWECAIPWSELQAPLGLDSITDLSLCGVFANSSVLTSNRYLSANVLASESVFHDGTDGLSNPGFGAMTLTPLVIEPRGGKDVAVTGVSPDTAGAGGVVRLWVTVTNRQNAPVSFELSANNLSGGAAPAPVSVSNLPPASSRDVELTWDTASLGPGSYPLAVSAGPVPGEVYTADNTREHTVLLRVPLHDMAVRSASAPQRVAPGDDVTVEVEVGNGGDFEETCSVTLHDADTGTFLASSGQVTIPPLSSAMTSLVWSTGTTAPGGYSIRGTAGPVPGDAV